MINPAGIVSVNVPASVAACPLFVAVIT